ncbi:hypothetical protein D3C80_1348080 [compost metagenome]
MPASGPVPTADHCSDAAGRCAAGLRQCRGSWPGCSRRTVPEQSCRSGFAPIASDPGPRCRRSAREPRGRGIRAHRRRGHDHDHDHGRDRALHRRDHGRGHGLRAGCRWPAGRCSCGNDCRTRRRCPCACHCRSARPGRWRWLSPCSGSDRRPRRCRWRRGRRWRTTHRRSVRARCSPRLRPGTRPGSARRPRRTTGWPR